MSSLNSIELPRGERGRFQSTGEALKRFVEKCRFEPSTGCVIWAGGTSAGRGNSAEYGVFWDDGRRHFAHRWSAVNILRLPVEGLQVGHCCPMGPQTLCVHHLEAQTQKENLAEQAERRRQIVQQTAEERRYWLLVQLGYEPPPELIKIEDSIPFFEEPRWFRQAKQRYFAAPAEPPF